MSEPAIPLFNFLPTFVVFLSTASLCLLRFSRQQLVSEIVIANDLNLAELSEKLQTAKARREMKVTPADERLKELTDTIKVKADAIKGNVS